MVIVVGTVVTVPGQKETMPTQLHQ